MRGHQELQLPAREGQARLSGEESWIIVPVSLAENFGQPEAVAAIKISGSSLEFQL